MTKRLISFDSEKPDIGLPGMVVEQLDDRFAAKEDVSTSAGFVGVISDTAPASPTQDGMPVIWFKTVTTNTIPEIDTLTLGGDGLSVTANFTGSDQDGDPLTYAVDWGDGTVGTDAISPATHTYTAEGEYTVTVTVTDVWEATATATGTIYVSPAIANRWAYDSFSYPDGTILAGWQTSAVKTPSLTTEEGNLTWEPGDQTTGGLQVEAKAHVNGGVFIEGVGDSRGEANRVSVATLNVPETSYRVALDYTIGTDSPRHTLSRVGLYFACSPTTARDTSGTTSLSIRLLDGLKVQIHTQSNGTFTLVHEVPEIPRQGRLSASFDAATGAVTLAISGQEVWSGTYAGPAYAKVGFDARMLATVDNFEVGPL